MNGIWSKVKDFVGFTDPVDGLDEYPIEGREDYQTLYDDHQVRRGSSSPTQPLSELEIEDDADMMLGGQAATSMRDRQWRAEADRRRRPEEWSDPAATSAPRSRRSSRNERSLSHNGGNNVIGLPTVNQSISSEVVVIEPRSFDEMAQVVQHLRDRKSVIMNLTLMDPADAQRSVDFVAGGTYAIDGHQERIGENIFLFTPSCVTVTTPGSMPMMPSGHAQQRPMNIPTPIWSSPSYPDMVPAVGQR